MTWSSPATNGSPIKYYTLLKDVGSSIFYPLYQGLSTSYNDTDLVEGEAYNYKIYATNGAGDGPSSVVTTGYAGEVPGIVEDLAIVT